MSRNAATQSFMGSQTQAILIAALLNACSPSLPASPTVPGRASPVATAVLSSPPPDADTGSPPPLNALEAKIVDTLETLGIQAQQADHSFRGADMWAQFDGGLELFVSAYPADIGLGDFTVVGERQIAGVRVKRLDYGSGLPRSGFACDDANYLVDGAVPPGFADMDAFLTRFIDALDCV